MALKEAESLYEETVINVIPFPNAGEIRPIRRVNLFPDSPDRGFLLYNLLSPSECEYYIEHGEDLGLKQVTYREDYRNCQRVVGKSEELARILYQRLEDQLCPVVVDELSPDDSLSEPYQCGGRWDPVGLNDHFRICKYTVGGHFGPHFDGNFRRSSDERSWKTFMLYLNSPTEGGNTNFLCRDAEFYVDPRTKRVCSAPGQVQFQVRPEAGMAICFNHQIMHEGEALSAGVKYIMRSEIMYRRAAGF
jgi:hypothetical protein